MFCVHFARSFGIYFYELSGFLLFLISRIGCYLSFVFVCLCLYWFLRSFFFLPRMPQLLGFWCSTCVLIVAVFMHSHWLINTYKCVVTYCQKSWKLCLGKLHDCENCSCKNLILFGKLLHSFSNVIFNSMCVFLFFVLCVVFYTPTDWFIMFSFTLFLVV